MHRQINGNMNPQEIIERLSLGNSEAGEILTHILDHDPLALVNLLLLSKMKVYGNEITTFWHFCHENLAAFRDYMQYFRRQKFSKDDFAKFLNH